MSIEIALVYAVMVAILVIPMVSRLRYDLVTLLALLLLALLGVTAPERTFAGYGHPAVITVAAVLVVSRGLQNAGIVDLLARWLGNVGQRYALQLAALCGLTAIASAFMNYIGALALFIPVTIRLARRSQRPASHYLLPLAFSAHLGGMMTLIGTPANLIVSAIRAEYVGQPFRVLDFFPLGLGIAIVVVLFIAGVGWRLIPRRDSDGRADGADRFEIERYLSEVQVPPESALADRPVRALRDLTKADMLIVRIRRGEQRLPAPSGFELIHPGDTLMVRANAENLSAFVRDTGVVLAESKPLPAEDLQSDEIALAEAIIAPDSPLVRRTARQLDLRARYGVNLLAVSRPGARLRAELASVQLAAGDVLLLQGYRDTLPQTLQRLGCLPLAERDLQLEPPKRGWLATGLFAAALLLAGIGILPIEIALSLSACAMILLRVLTVREAYASIDWPIIVLVGAMLALGEAMETTGGAQLIADQIVSLSTGLKPVVMLVSMLVANMILSDLIKNEAQMVLMAPIAIGVAQGLGVSPDPFLVAVAIGGSCAFLTPIGHQSNVLVLEPGGYRFGDYWRLGLPISLLVIAVGVPLMLLLWPL
jgi:di/tricarboxylate transporter